MAQANYTPIQLYRSTTASAVPTSGNLTDGELAINTADGKLFYKNSGGAVRLLSIGYGSSTVTPTNGGVQYGTGSALALTAAGSSGQILRSNGAAAPTWENLSALGVSTISFGTTGLTPNSATSGAVTVAGTLATTNGGTGLTSFTANQVFYASSTSAVAQSSNLLYSGTDLTVYGITVGRGAGAVSTNTAVGASALAAVTTGANLVGVGYGALQSNTSGPRNIAIGRNALNANTTSGDNTAVGHASLELSTGSNNTAIGSGSLQANTTASNNTAVGYQAGYSNTTGSPNIYLGYQAGRNATGSYSISIGYQAGYNDTDVTNGNIFVGYQAGYANTSGSGILAVGTAALTANTTGSYNTAVGRALIANTTGNNNTSIGYQSLNSSTTASNNTAVGYQAAYSNTTGSGILAVGYQAGYSNTVGNGNTAIGNGNAFTGAALYSNVSGNNNVAVGSGSLNSTTASNNTAVGYEAAKLTTSGGSNVALGTQALYSNTTASNNTAVGYYAGYTNTTGTNLTALGQAALVFNTTGSQNVAVGNEALRSNTTASNNTAVGYQAGYSNTTGTANTYLGEGAGYSNTASSYNTFIGEAAGRSFNTSGNSGNTFVGVGAGYGTTTGTANTFVGAWNPATTVGCGQLVTTGSKNTILGGYNGNQGGLDIRTASNYIVLSDGDGNPRVWHDGTWLVSPNSIAQGNTQNINYGSGISFGAAGKGLLLQQTVNTNDERVYLTNNAQTSTASGFTGAFAYNKTGAAATTYYQVAGQHLWLSADVGTAGNTISWANILSAKKDTTVALQGASLQSGTGITFPASQSASSDANTLDDYEEGTWTPTITASVTGTLSVSYTSQGGWYTKVGRQVFASFRVAFSLTKGTASGDILISGYPFTPANTGYGDAQNGSIGFVSPGGFPVSPLGLVQNASSSTTYVGLTGGGTAAITSFADSTTYDIRGTYSFIV